MGGKRSRQPILQLSSFVTQEDDQSTMDKSNSIPTTTFVRQSVCGSDMQRNEIGLSMVPFAKANIIFFPGDVQDFQQEMCQGSFRDFCQEYSYEQMPLYLRAQFGTNVNIWIIRPANIQPLGYSCYSHFLSKCHPQYGSVESYDPNGHATMHLMALMQNVCAQMEVEKKDHLHLLNRPLHLVGFSKGVVVLNQLITEMSTSETFGTARTVSCMNAKLSSFYNTIVSFQWLGGGNGSNRGAFPLYSIPNTGKRIQYGIHITPYQLYSNERPWIREEMQQFVSKLHSRHIPVSSCVYFEHEPPSLHQHFQLLQVWQLENCPNWYLDSKSNSNSNSNSSNDSSIDVRTGQNCGFNSVATSSSSSSTSDASMAQ